MTVRLDTSNKGRSISTHILTRRMTVQRVCRKCGEVFQLTSSRGGWPTICLDDMTDEHFNSHPHEEDDIKNWYICCICNISTHILTRRMTTWLWRIFLQVKYFNSHPHEEDDGGQHSQRLQLQHFNSHPHEEDDYTDKFNGVGEFISTHILTRRMTIWRWQKWVIIWYFNSHPHEEDDSYVDMFAW